MEKGYSTIMYNTLHHCLFLFSVLLCADLKYAILFSGLDVDGIYRVSGNLATIQKLKFIVNQGKRFLYFKRFSEVTSLVMLRQLYTMNRQ